ncbi:MAG: carboxypeptidase-like regulatory domain-containing protein [Vicinamibacterales bacterium]|nr:carboxypeptidase-like regulatory domain-containing protein [Vicinamibacterales bacterium]
MKARGAVRHVVLLVLAMALGAPVPGLAGPSELAGRVHATDGAPVAGATVTMRQPESDRVRVAITDAHGRFTLNEFTLTGAVTITVEHPAFAPATTVITVEPPPAAPLELVLAPRGARP